MRLPHIILLSACVYLAVASNQKVDLISSILNQVGEQILGEMTDDNKEVVRSIVDQGVQMTKDWDWAKIQKSVGDFLDESGDEDVKHHEREDPDLTKEDDLF